MGSMFGVIAGAAAIGGAVALYRFAHRRTASVRASIDEIRRKAENAARTAAGEYDGVLMDYERDRDGVYRPKP